MLIYHIYVTIEEVLNLLNNNPWTATNFIVIQIIYVNFHKLTSNIFQTHNF